MILKFQYGQPRKLIQRDKVSLKLKTRAVHPLVFVNVQAAIEDKIMCRLFSYITKTPKKCVDLLEKFKNDFSENNPDGWGTGWYTQKKAQYYKEGIPAHDPDSKFSQIAKDAESKIIISHVRKLSEAPPTTENAHPFHENNWLFIHNGAVHHERFF